MRRLSSFSLHYDCTDRLLEALADACAGTLRRLTVERSGHVTDEAVDTVLRYGREEGDSNNKTLLSKQRRFQIRTKVVALQK